MKRVLHGREKCRLEDKNTVSTRNGAKRKFGYNSLGNPRINPLLFRIPPRQGGQLLQSQCHHFCDEAGSALCSGHDWPAPVNGSTRVQ